MPKMITKTEIRKDIMSHSGLTLLKFKTNWSGTCQILEPVYNDLENAYQGTVRFYTIDVDNEKDLDKEFGIMELPTILFFKDGKLIDHAVGLTSRNILISKIENAISKN